ncbi:MAG: DegT/DnrJ/EryC1/StrS family aminotransferase [Pseudomonadota bacterium]
MPINFVDLKRQYDALKGDIHAALDRVLEHGRFIMGPEIDQLENQLAEFVGVRQAIVCSSGTDALLMPLMAKGLGPGDAVFTSPFTFIATAEVISLLGATPVFVDIDPKTFNLDPHKLEEAVKQTMKQGKLRPAGVIPVDLFGLPADYDPIMDTAEKHGLFVLEDAAQSFGGVYKGRRAGGLGHAAATSFFPAKPLGCYGDGGAVFTNDDALADIIKSIRAHGQGDHKYENVRIGINGRMDTLQAAILLVKLGVFSRELEARDRVAGKYSAALAGLVETPFIPDGYASAWAQYSILADQPGEMMAALKTAGIPAAVYYPKPLHLQKAFSGLGLGPGDFPVSERTAQRIFSLPMHPYLNDSEIERIVAGLGNPQTRQS